MFAAAPLNLLSEADPISLKLQSLRIDPSAEVAPKQSCFEVDGQSVFSIGEISTVIGKAKSFKTTILSLIAANLLGAKSYRLSGKSIGVLWIDCEQGSYFAHKAVQRIVKLVGEGNPINLFAYGMRSQSPAERLQLIEKAIETLPVDVVFIDGIRDLVNSINSEEEATTVVTQLMQWSDSGKHICCVLHQNKNDQNARGHVGTELVNKSETVLTVTKQPDGQIVVSQDFSRGLPMTDFAIEMQDNLPVVTDTAIREKAPKILPESLQAKVFAEVFKSVDAGLQYGTLQKDLYTVFSTYGHSVGTNKIKKMITDALTNGTIERNNNNGGHPRYFSKVV